MPNKQADLEMSRDSGTMVEEILCWWWDWWWDWYWNIERQKHIMRNSVNDGLQIK